MRETAQASWSGSSGSCAHGLSNPASSTASSGPTGESRTAVAYRVIDVAGVDFALPAVNPEAHATFTTTPRTTRGAGCGVSYSADLTSLKIDLSGVVDSNTDKRTAIGYSVLATVSGAPFLSSYSWSVSGCGPFSSYRAYESYAEVIPWIDTGHSSTAVAFKEEGTAQVSCRVQNATYGIDVTLHEYVYPKKPSYTTPLNTVGSFVKGLLTIQGQPVEVFRLYNSATHHGKDVHQIVNDPPVIAALGLGSSEVADYQLLNADYSSTPSTSPPPINGAWVLDTFLPYVSAHANPPGTTQGAEILAFADSPGLDDIQYFTQIKHKAAARIYLMYRPSVITAQWVPIARQEWSWHGQMSRASTSAAWGPIYNNNVNGSMVDYHEHPVWGQNIDPSKNP